MFPAYCGLVYHGLTKWWQPHAPGGHAPKRFCDDLPEHLSTFPGAGKVLGRMLPNPRQRNLPMTSDSALCHKLEKHRSYSGNPGIVYELTDAVLLGGYAGSVQLRTAGVVSELSPYPWGPACHPSLRSLHLEPPVRLYGRTLCLATPEIARNYYHFMVDCLPKLSFLHALGIDPRAFDSVVINSQASFCRKILFDFGIEPESVRYLSDQSNFSAASLTIPFAYPTLNGMDAWQIDGMRWVFEQCYPDLSPSTARRIYVVRGNTLNRRLVNEASLMSRLEAMGFQCVDCARLSLEQQMAVFRDAELVVASHGAALTNLAFCRPGTRVVEIVNPEAVHPFYWALSDIRQLDYHIFPGIPCRASATASHRRNLADFSVNEQSLYEYLQLI